MRKRGRTAADDGQAEQRPRPAKALRVAPLAKQPKARPWPAAWHEREGSESSCAKRGPSKALPSWLTMQVRTKN